MTEQVRVVLTSEVLEGFSVDEVKRELGRVFQLDAVRLNAMFAGGRTVLKRAVSPEEGRRYAKKLASLGARVHLEPASAPPSVPTPVASARAESPRLPSVPLSAPREASALKLVDFEAAGDEQIECPNCGERQPKCVYCRSCTTDIARGMAAKLEAQEEVRQARLDVVRQRQEARRAHLPAETSAPSLFGFGFSGRLARGPYAAAGLFCWTVLVLLVVGFARSPGLFTLVLMLVGLLVVAVWSLRAAVLRLHDMDMSAWWSILLFVPYLGMAASLLLMVLPGTHGDNDYGEPARRGNWLLAFVSLALLCLTLGLAWRTVSLAFRGDLPGLPGIEAPVGDAGEGSTESVPDTAMRNIPPGEAAEDFHQNYWPASTHKAFAVSSAGAWGWKAGAASVEQAARDALSACESRREPYTPSCVLVNLNGYSGQPDR